jgi:uncharacterized membrane protein
MSDEANISGTPAAVEQQEAEAVIGIISDGAHSLIVARFPTIEEAQDAYAALTKLERTTSIKVDSVLIARSDHEGKIHLGTVTEHSTKTGVKWGVVGGVLIGVLFPPTILAGAIAGGAAGGILGKVRNVFHRHGIAEELAKVMKPDTAGIIALVEDTAVVAVQQALAEADEIVTRAVDKQVAAEIDREAAAAKESISAA